MSIMSDTVHNVPERPLRILTIDNGGLQAISLLTILRDVCKAVSDAEGLSTVCDPWKIFDVIAGVGTGGWLAILLGRYRLSIGDCLAVYMMLVEDLRPSRIQPEKFRESGKSVALNNAWLVDWIEELVGQEELGQYMVDEHEPNCSETASRRCYSFAAGPKWRSSSAGPREYHLFRSYPPASQSTLGGPDPSRLRVSQAFAATAAGQHFMQAYEIDGTRYWDESFPFTHAISKIALTEVESLFGGQVPISLLLNISPGLPTKSHIKSLGTAAKRNTATLARLKNRIGSLLGTVSLSKNKAHKDLDLQLRQHIRSLDRQHRPLLISDTSVLTNSTSSKVAQIDFEQEEDIHEVLLKGHQSGDVYLRLQAGSMDEIPYLDDCEEFVRASKVGEQCCKENESILKKIVAICTNKNDGSSVPATTAHELQMRSLQDMVRHLLLASGRERLY